MVWLTVPGTFYLTAVINAINFITWCCTVESTGKSDKEQKLLYAPKNEEISSLKQENLEKTVPAVPAVPDNTRDPNAIKAKKR